MQTRHQNVYRDTTTWWGHTTWDMSTLYPLSFFLSLSGGRLGFRPWWRLRVSSGCKESSCSSLATASLCGLGAADRDTSTGSSSFSPAPPPSSPFPAMTEGGRHTTPEKSTLAFVMATCKTKQKNIDHKSHTRVLAIRPVQCGVFHAIEKHVEFVWSSSTEIQRIVEPCSTQQFKNLYRPPTASPQKLLMKLQIIVIFLGSMRTFPIFGVLGTQSWEDTDWVTAVKSAYLEPCWTLDYCPFISAIVF